MTAHIDSTGRLHHPEAHDLSLTCPHCQQLTHISLLAAPGFAELSALRPAMVGVIYSCDSCRAPIFVRYPARAYNMQRIELGPHFQQVERARERFAFQYLPAAVESVFREALTCHAAEAYTAFALMCRRIVHTVHQDLGDSARLRMFEQLNDVREMLSLDESTFSMIKRALFGSDAKDVLPGAMLNAWQAGVLLEVIKDLLNQAYVRKARLQHALQVRNFFADEARDA